MVPLEPDIPGFGLCRQSIDQDRLRANRTGGGPLTADPISGVLSDPSKRRMAAQLLGQAYMAAHLLVAANKDAVERVAEAVIAKGEIYGNELVALLDAQSLQIPTVDLTKDDPYATGKNDVYQGGVTSSDGTGLAPGRAGADTPRVSLPGFAR